MFELVGQGMQSIVKGVHADAVLGVLVGLTWDNVVLDSWLLGRKDYGQQHQCHEQHLDEIETRHGGLSFRLARKAVVREGGEEVRRRKSQAP